MDLQISAEKLAEILKGEKPPHLLDVRQPEEHETATLANATLIPLGQLAGRAKEIEAWKDEDVVVYCHHGVRSMQVTMWLRARGIQNCYSVAGGIDRWSCEVDQNVPRY